MQTKLDNLTYKLQGNHHNSSCMDNPCCPLVWGPLREMTRDIQTANKESLSDYPCLPSLRLEMLWGRHLEILSTGYSQNSETGLKFTPTINSCFSLLPQKCLLIPDCCLYHTGLALGGRLQDNLLKWIELNWPIVRTKRLVSSRRWNNLPVQLLDNETSWGNFEGGL